ncbi:MAG TPA: hypothetical protein VGR72_15260 [Candidatus Acidoferrales bacterium]|nr:hypothetical protein [Candidatus Acidoferrales bacterium]
MTRPMIESFFELVMRAMKDEARQLEGLRGGIGKNTDFASLALYREEWYTPVLFKELYRDRTSEFSLFEKPEPPGAAGSKVKGKLDLEVRGATNEAAFIEIKGWWPGQTEKLAGVMRDHARQMANYPKNCELLLMLFAHCKATDGKLKMLVDPIPGKLNESLRTDLASAKFSLTISDSFDHLVEGGEKGEFGVVLLSLARGRDLAV